MGLDVSNVKVGDRVRATCGESVIVGEVTGRGDFGITVNVEGTDGHKHWMPTSVWNVEAIAPPIPDIVGTIVRDKNDEAWQRHEVGWYPADNDSDFYDFVYLQDYAPLTVLWTPEP